jgi:uncharacterized membrane protein
MSYVVLCNNQVALRCWDGVCFGSNQVWAPDEFSIAEADHIKNELLKAKFRPAQIRILPASGLETRQELTPEDATRPNQIKTVFPPEPEPEPEAQKQQVKEEGEPMKKGANAAGHAAGIAVNILTKPWQKALTPYIIILYILLIIGVFFVCLWNIFPYELAVRFVSSKFLDSGIVRLVLSLPLIGWLLGIVGNSIYWIVGTSVWGAIQLIELLPLVMTSNPGYVRSVLQEQEATEQIRPNQDDPGLVRYLKKFYNQLPLRFLATARRLRGWVYVIDMLIVMMVYPPVKEGGVARFIFLLSTGQWGQFDWGNIVLMFVTLFAVEAVVKVLIIVNHFRNYLKASKRQPANA